MSFIFIRGMADVTSAKKQNGSATCLVSTRLRKTRPYLARQAGVARSTLALLHVISYVTSRRVPHHGHLNVTEAERSKRNRELSSELLTADTAEPRYLEHPVVSKHSSIPMRARDSGVLLYSYTLSTLSGHKRNKSPFPKAANIK